MKGSFSPSPDDLILGYRLTEQAVIVSAVGEIDQLTLGPFRSTLSLALHEPSAHAVIVDLTGVTFLGSQGLNALLNAREEAQRANEALRLVVGHQHPVLLPLELTGLDKVFEVCETVQDAIY